MNPLNLAVDSPQLLLEIFLVIVIVSTTIRLTLSLLQPTLRILEFARGVSSRRSSNVFSIEMARRALVNGSCVVVVSEDSRVFASSVWSLIVKRTELGSRLRAVDVCTARRSPIRVVFEKMSEEVCRIFEVASGRRCHLGGQSVGNRVSIET